MWPPGSPAGGPGFELLRTYVTDYVFYDLTGWREGFHRGLPDGTATLVVDFAGRLAVRGRTEATADAVVGGLTTEAVEIALDGPHYGAQVSMTPLGARAMLGATAGELDGSVWALGDLVGRRAGSLHDRVASASPARRAAVLAEALQEWVDPAVRPGLADAAWARVREAHGCVRVESLAAQFGVTRRYLSQVMAADLGISPKTLARVFRFARARHLLRSGRARSLAEAAVLCGYYDQAHLNRDWKLLGGATPGDWLRDEFPFLQDGALSGPAH